MAEERNREEAARRIGSASGSVPGSETKVELRKGQGVSEELREIVESKVQMSKVQGSVEALDALEIFGDVADELLTLEDLDPDYDPDAELFDGPDELMVLDDMEFSLDDDEKKETVVAKMEGPEAASAALLRLKEEDSTKRAESAASADESGAGSKLTPEELRKRWKDRAKAYQKNISSASAKVIAVSKTYDKMAVGSIPVGDVVRALEDLGVSLTKEEEARMLDEIETLPKDGFRCIFVFRTGSGFSLCISML